MKMSAAKKVILYSAAVIALAGITAAKIYDRKATEPYSSDREYKWNTRSTNLTQPDPVVPAESTADQRTERLGGYPSSGYGSSISVSTVRNISINIFNYPLFFQGYPHSGSGVGSYYSPLKFNIGGIVLGTLVGVGALLLLPKLASAFHGGNSGYYRSEDSSSDFTQLMHSVSNFLDENRVDSSACVKRMICSSVRNSEYNLENQTADQIDTWISGLAENSFVKYMVNGTQINEALVVGKRKNGQDCAETYRDCQLDKDMVLNMFKKLM